MIDPRERYQDQEEQLSAALDGFKSKLWTALPGIIQSFTIANGSPIASVQPAVKAMMVGNLGALSPVNLPLLPHVPVCFPRGGGCSLTFPVAPGDECLLVFSARALDGWWQSGKAQPSTDLRSHDLSDAVAFVGLTSQARPLSGISIASTQLRSDDGSTVIDLNPSAQTVTFKAPGGIFMDGPVTATSTIVAQGNVTAGSIDLENHVHVNAGGSGLSGKPQG